MTALSPGNIAKQISNMRSRLNPELVIYLLTLVFWIICLVGGAGLSILGFFLSLMRGSLGQEDQSAKEMELLRSKKKKAPAKSESQDAAGEGEKEEIQKRKP